MKKTALYSSARPGHGAGGQVQPIARAGTGNRQGAASAASEGAAPAGGVASAPTPDGGAAALARRSRWERMRAGALPLAMLLLGAALVLALQQWREPSRPITQKDIDQAVLHTLGTQTLPSPAARAYETIRRSVVRVRGLSDPDEKGQQKQLGVGSGVIVVDQGLILTNLHVALAAPRLEVVFDDGHTSAADVVGTQPEHDLAVIKARSLPDDVQPATLRSTADLAVGEQVLAVGFPFGIGPSASAGVVSGLRREFRSPEGERLLTNLIQFDAAANPGSSGGPLVTMDGEVVGIVTAILNPTEHRVFVGIGFAVPIENAAAAAGMPPF